MRLRFAVLTTFLLFAFVIPATAAGPTLPTLIPANCSGPQTGSLVNGTYTLVQGQYCGLNDLLQTAVNLSQYLLGILGSLTLIVFIYGGIVWLTSAGNMERVKRGRAIFEGALVGLIIIFSSALIINFVIAALSGQSIGQKPVLFKGQTGEQPALQVPGVAPTQ